MEPPKYNFYIGKNAQAIFYNNETIDSTGEYVSNTSMCASSSIAVDGESAIFLNVHSTYSTSVEPDMIYVHCYNNGSYLGKLYTSGNEIVNLLADTTDFAITFYKSNTNIYDKVQNNLTFIYFIQSASPHYKDLSKKYTKESGQEFFRESLDGKINLFGNSYEFVKNSSLENQFIFIIDKYHRSSRKWVRYYKGEFSKTDCKFDHSKKKCELKTTAIDSYSEVMNKYASTYDLIKLAPEISHINLHKRSLIQIYIRGANSITNFFGGTYWEDDVNEAIDNHDSLINKYFFSYIKAGNEFYISGSSISNVNGVYAGTNGSWQNNSGYRCEYVKVISIGDFVGTPSDKVYDINSNENRAPLTEETSIGPAVYSEDLYKLRIIQSSDNAIVYESKWLFYSSLPYIDGDIYIDRNDIELVNVNNSADIANINTTFVYHIYKRILCDVDTVESPEGPKSTYNLPANDFVTDNRNYKKCIGLGGGMLFCTSKTVDEPTKYGLNDYGKYFTDRFISTTTGIGRALPISKNSWANASLWYVYDSDYEYFEERLRKQYMLKDCYSIGAAIKAILNKIDPTLKHEPTAEYSKFLYDSTNPLGMDRFYVYITQKSNVLKGNYDQPAQKAETSLEELMKMLRDCFRCYWYIENNKFKIEHIYFFMRGGSYNHDSSIQLDFTKLIDQFNKTPAIFFQSEVEFDKSDLSQRYEFSWMDNVTDLFGGMAVDIKASYIQKGKTEEISIVQFSSDVDFMLFNPSNFSNDGFALLCPIKNGSALELPIITIDTLIDENGNTYKAVAQNWYASWIYLLNSYLWDMPAQNIEASTVGNFHAIDVKKCMKHTIEFSSEEDLDTLKLIKTHLGDGKIDEYSINMNTRMAKVKLAYRPQ